MTKSIKISSVLDYLLISRARSYAYVFVPKAACSTAKVALWLAERELDPSIGPLDTPMAVHTRQYHTDSPWLSAADGNFKTDVDRKCSENLFLFSIVRNPYSRIFSAYRNKILGVGKGVDRHDYLADIGWTQGAPPNFREFLEILTDQDPLTHNPHWQSITNIIAYDNIEYDRIYHAETFTKDFSDISGRIFKDSSLQRYEKIHINATHSEDRKLKSYSDKSIALLQGLYKRDFVNFGYDLDISSPLPLKS